MAIRRVSWHDVRDKGYYGVRDNGVCYPILRGYLTVNSLKEQSHIIHVHCPQCDMWHTHGWPKGSGNTPQPRVPHCPTMKFFGHDHYYIAPHLDENNKPSNKTSKI
jgi:hypothetical protein